MVYTTHLWYMSNLGMVYHCFNHTIWELPWYVRFVMFSVGRPSAAQQLQATSHARPHARSPSVTPLRCTKPSEQMLASHGLMNFGLWVCLLTWNPKKLPEMKWKIHLFWAQPRIPCVKIFPLSKLKRVISVRSLPLYRIPCIYMCIKNSVYIYTYMHIQRFAYMYTYMYSM